MARMSAASPQQKSRQDTTREAGQGVSHMFFHVLHEPWTRDWVHCWTMMYVCTYMRLHRGQQIKQRFASWPTFLIDWHEDPIPLPRPGPGPGRENGWQAPVQRIQTDNCLLHSQRCGYHFTTNQSVGSSGPTGVPKEISWRRQMEQTRPLKPNHSVLDPIAVAIASYFPCLPPSSLQLSTLVSCWQTSCQFRAPSPSAND